MRSYIETIVICGSLFLILVITSLITGFLTVKFLFLGGALFTILAVYPLVLFWKNKIPEQPGPMKNDELQVCAEELKTILQQKSLKHLLLYINTKLIFPGFLLYYLFYLLAREMPLSIFLENLYPKQMDLILILICISGAIMVFSPSFKLALSVKPQSQIKDGIISSGFAFTASLMIFKKTAFLENLSYLVAVLTFILILLISMLVLNENEK